MKHQCNFPQEWFQGWTPLDIMAETHVPSFLQPLRQGKASGSTIPEDEAASTNTSKSMPKSYLGMTASKVVSSYFDEPQIPSLAIKRMANRSSQLKRRAQNILCQRTFWERQARKFTDLMRWLQEQIEKSEALDDLQRREADLLRYLIEPKLYLSFGISHDIVIAEKKVKNLRRNNLQGMFSVLDISW